jgi:hypothetical protein
LLNRLPSRNGKPLEVYAYTSSEAEP